MKLLALLIGLLVEWLTTRLFQYRKFDVLDRAISFGFRQALHTPNFPALISVVLIVIVLVAPVFLILIGLEGPRYQFPYLIFAIIVLLLSFGPKDLGQNVDDYCNAVMAGDAEKIKEASTALTEADLPNDTLDCARMVEASICVQANRRLFAVMFWFMVLGPVGAWAYRVTNLVHYRASCMILRDNSSNSAQIVDASTMLHGLFDWIPTRLVAFGYAMVGSFDGALTAWRAPHEKSTQTAFEKGELLLRQVSTGALALINLDSEDLAGRAVRGAQAANRLVLRLGLLWAIVIGTMILLGGSI